jgi:hypothetical protein
MRACVVFCTIRYTKSFECYAKNFGRYGHTPDIVIVDESRGARNEIRKFFKNFNVEFYGVNERKEWFKTSGVDPQTVPTETTDVIGFALLIAYPRKYDMIVFVDDDTYPLKNVDFLSKHYQNLNNERMKVRKSANNWVNPHPDLSCFGRGYPYALRNRYVSYDEKNKVRGAILNMGLWTGVPDLNAIDYLVNYDNLLGRCKVEIRPDLPSYVLGSSYMPLSRMNIAFTPKIIPAFYQFTGNAFGIGRYGDVFSGLFLMKIAKHLGDHVSFGQPICIHDKEPRDVFRDIKTEMEAIKLNETMYKVLKKIQVSGSSYGSCYLNIANGLLAHREEFHAPEYIDFLVERMKGWVKETKELK